ncbi:RNA methyltransferase [Pedobacter sp. BS3]|uniref:methyltransferase RsmF C-terminal domain-like protein n=1 Tax=Pedobacter sp. BS3 TaxID=2567937 RepID=UPI0011EBF789|nr:RNA methyltransferase [Pedobacter sp. BS3]TZF83288.1 RNA methyltransferase [Pedobacter sp. BS3]
MSTILPSSFINSLKKNFNIEEELFFDVHEKAEKVVSIRLNPQKITSEFDNKTPVPWCNLGRYLDERPSFIADPLFHAGTYYVQEASSMFLEQVIKTATNPADRLKVLDLCAAPGGKSTHLLSLISSESLLVSNEIIKSRVSTLTENISKWGNTNVVVSNNDPKDFASLTDFFDVVVVDAPCSGSGMFRKDPETVKEWSESTVALCSQRQQRILADIYPALKQNGILIYSTCSYSAEENEQIADWLCDTFDLTSVQIPVDKSWNIIETQSDRHQCYGYRFYPHKVKGEGFFITCFKKNDGSTSSLTWKYKPEKVNPAHKDIIAQWISSDANYHLLPVGDMYTIVRTDHAPDIQHLQSRLYLKKAGTIAGKIAGKDLIPDHDLALSLLVSAAVNRVTVDEQTALKYLRKDDIRIDTSVKGWALICYQDKALGWAKLLPNRVNNYYPKELRILKNL